MTRLLMKNLKFQKFKRKGQEVILKNSSKIFRKKLNSFTQVTLWLRTINWKAPLSVGKVSNGFLFSKKFMMMRNISLQRVLKKMNLLMKIQMNTCQKSSIGSKVSSSSFLMMTMKATSLLITMQTQPLQNLLIWWVTSNRMAMLISSLQGWT